MTNEECIKMLKAKLRCMERSLSGIDEECNMLMCDSCDLNYAQGNMGEQKETLRMAIKALEKQATCDCVSRQAAIDEIKKIHPVDTEYDCTLYDKLDVMYVLKDLPSVTPQQKMGRWAILKDEYGDIVDAVCSCCDEHGNHEWAFCPKCGAKMQAESEDGNDV